MNDKPLSRQYLDQSSNKLIPYDINEGGYLTVTNNLTVPASLPTVIYVRNSNKRGNTLNV